MRVLVSSIPVAAATAAIALLPLNSAACLLQVYLHDSMFKLKDSSSSSSSSFDLVSYVDAVMPGA
jgi:hypothetical protein